MTNRGDRSRRPFRRVLTGTHGYNEGSPDPEAAPAVVYPPRMAVVPADSLTPLTAAGDGEIETGGATEQTVLSRTVTLTNAQIKALPTTGIELVPAPGAGKMILPLDGVASFSGSSAYTNVHADASLNVMWTGFNAHRWAAFSLLTFGADGVLPLNSVNNSVDPIGTSDAEVPSEFDNASLKISASNPGLGDFTGGHASNTLKVTLLYTVVDL